MYHRFTVVWLLSLTIIEGQSPEKTYRLPQQVVPENYEISLIPYLDMEGQRTFTFNGTVTITVKAITNAQNISLHAETIEITDIQSSSMKFRGISVNKKGIFEVKLEKPLQEQSVHNITIQYTGKISRERTGFYRSSYVTSKGEVRWLATTHFEPTGARRAFPCFDEPAFKATFLIRIAPPTGYHAVSNMPVESISSPDPNTENRVWYSFQRTPVMSTYLVAFVVSQYASIEKGIFKVWGDPEKVENGRYVLDVSPKILKTLEEFTDLAYPLPKLDQVAVPDFEPAAMENWGLVTYADKILLIQNTTDDTAQTLMTTAHEFSHSWFGNLVSPAWWQYLWLNEAFAAFLQFMVAHELAPEMNYFPEEFAMTQLKAMEMEENILSRPLSAEVDFILDKMFDLIPYNKGSSIVKMTRDFLTPTTFRKGLQIHLKRMAYKSATADDLFGALQEAVDEDKVLPTGLTVKAILDTWTLQAGYPLLTVKRDYEAGTANITQSAFNVPCTCTREKRWYIPITYTTRKEKDFNNTTPRLWLSPEQGSEVVLEGLGKDDWLILNILCSGYYRVNYDRRNWDLLSSALAQPSHGGIHPVHRAQILGDTQSLSKNKMLPEKNLFDILIGLRNDADPNVQKLVLKKMTQLYKRMNHLSHYNHIKEIFKPNLESMLMMREEQQTMNGNDLDSWKYALNDYTQPKVDREGSPAEWCAAVRSNTNEAWDAVWSLYKQASSTKRRRDALAALGCAPDAQRLLSAAMPDAGEEERVLEDDRAAALAAPCGSETRAGVGGGGADACLEAVNFFAKNVRRISRSFNDTDDFVNLARNIASKLQTEEQYGMLRFAAMKFHDREDSPLPFELWMDVLRISRTRLDSIKEDETSIKTWLRERGNLY